MKSRKVCVIDIAIIRQAIERGLKKCRRNGDIDNKITAMRLI